MGLLLRIITLLAALMIGISAIQMLASESGEVVVLTSYDEFGEGHRTRLWVVEYNGSQWLRSGGPVTTWYGRLQANPYVRVSRGDRSFEAVAHPEPDEKIAINQLMLDKYGWADRWIGLLFPRDGVVPIRLEVIPAGADASAARTNVQE